MTYRKFIAASLATLTAVALPAAASDLLLEARFDQSPQAQTPTGQLAAIIPAGMTPEYAPGVQGLAFQTRGDQPEWNQLGYAVSNLWPRAQGTVLFWAKGDGLKLEWGSAVTFFRLWGKNGWLWFYKPGGGGQLGVLSRCTRAGDTKETDSFLAVPPEIAYHLVPTENYGSSPQSARETDLNDWQLWALTWSGPRTRLYLNGILQAENAHFTWPDSPSLISIGNFAGGLTVRFDDLRLYRRPLDADELRRLWLDTLRPLTDCQVVVPALRQPVTLDGRLAVGEWADATQISTLCREDGLHAAAPSTVYLKHDATNLYVACHSPWPAATLKNSALTAGLTGLLQAGDQVVIELGANTAGAPSARFTIDGAGVPSPGNWRAKDSQNDRGWDVEAIIPLPQLTNQVGGLNVQRVWHALKQETQSWVWGGRPAPGAAGPGPLGKVIWGDAAALRVADLAYGDLDQGRVDFHATLANPGPSDRVLTAKLDSSSGEVRQEFTVTAGATERLAHSQMLQNPSTADLSFVVSAGTDVLYRSEVNFLRPQRLEVVKWFYPSTNRLRLKLIASRLAGELLAHTAAVIELVAAGKTKPVLTKTIKPLHSAEEELTINAASLADGKYEIRTTLFAGGQKLFASQVPFEKRPLPAWFNSRAGISEKVPPPFTPLVCQGQTVRAWGREYVFDSGLLPRQIKTQGMALLRAPIRVVASFGVPPLGGSRNGPPESGTPNAAVTLDSSIAISPVHWLSRKPARIEGRGQVRAGRATISNNLWIEYDGLLWNTITVAGTRHDTLENLALEIPLTKEFSELINPCDYLLRTTGLLATNGYTASARTIWLGNAYGGLQWTYNSRANWDNRHPNEELQVVPGPDGATLRIVFRDVPTKLDRPVAISFGLQATPVKPRYPEYRHWLSQDARRLWEIRWFPPGQVFRPGPEGWFAGPLIVPKPADFLQMPLWRSRACYRLCDTCYQAVYASPDVTDATTPDFAQFADEWASQPDEKYVPDPNAKDAWTYVCADAKSYRDYYLWRYARLMDRQPFAAIYYDGASGQGGANPFSGVGERDRSGVLVPTTGVLGLRDITQRLYCLVKERFPQAIIVYHNSGQPVLTFMSFADAFMDGENTFSLLSPAKRDYYGTMRPDVFRAEYMGHNFGFVTVFLPQFTRANVWTPAQLATPQGLALSDQIIGQSLLHDADIADSYISGDAMTRLAQALRRHQWGPQYKMIPYWEQQAVKLPPRMFATFYVEQQPGAPAPVALDSGGYYFRAVPGPAQRVIGVFYNDGDWGGVLRLPMDWNQLGITAAKDYQIENAVHRFTFPILDPGAGVTGQIHGTGEDQFLVKYTVDPHEFARVENGELVFPMTPHNYRMIVLWQK